MTACSTSSTTAGLDRDLRRAIAGKRLIQLAYKGRARTVEPHDYGIQKGTVRLLAYQRTASGQSGDVRGWRLLDVSKIDGCVVLEDTFEGSRGADHQRHYEWDVLYARVT